jgi:two-component system NarL family sensor kinase
MNLSSITHRVGRDADIGKIAEESRELAHQLSKEIRTLSYLLHPPLLDENGLSEAIRWYIQGLAERSGLKIELDISEDFGRLPDDLEVAIFRIVQECLTNIHRHSGGKTATIRLSRNFENVFLGIQDDGTGIPSETLAAIRTQRSGVGTTGMRERVGHFRGTIDIQSSANGTKISVTFPVSTVASSGSDKPGQQSRAAE